ncbi:hypothetical protein FA10DRAFT_270002, partial [Acaromyces ingoldii]
MASQQDLSKIQWEQKTNVQGMIYEVGRWPVSEPLGNPETALKMTANRDSDDDRSFDVAVDWPYAGKSQYLPTTPEVEQKTGIYNYYFDSSWWPYFDAAISIWTNGSNVLYYFTMNTGEEFSLSVDLPFVPHIVRMKLENPDSTKVVRIHGEVLPTPRPPR